MDKATQRRVEAALRRLQEARLSVGSSQETVADHLGINRSSYARLENADTAISLRQFVTACLSVGLDPAAALSDDAASVRASREALKARTTLARIQTLLKSDKDAWS